MTVPVGIKYQEMKIILIDYTLNENSTSYHVVNVASCEKNEHLFLLSTRQKPVHAQNHACVYDGRIFTCVSIVQGTILTGAVS